MAAKNKWVDEKIKERGLTQNLLGKNLGWDRSLISRKLRGERRFKLEEICQIAKLLGVSKDEFIVNLGIKEWDNNQDGLFKKREYWTHDDDEKELRALESKLRQLRSTNLEQTK